MQYSVFDIIGPRMIGPSSSHTAGAARLGYIAWKIAGRDVAAAEITLYGSFAETGSGHGTDKAIVAGLLGLAPDDERLRWSMLFANESGVKIDIIRSDAQTERPNTVRIRATARNGAVTEIVGASVGGGSILITGIDGMAVEFTGDYPTLIVKHKDVPGVINSVTGILAKEQVNVAFMRVFRQTRRMEAFMVIETDTPVQERTLQLILDWCPDIEGVRAI